MLLHRFKPGMRKNPPPSCCRLKLPQDSGIDHVHARCDPKRYQRQIRLFHDIIGFKRLGAVYDDKDPDGRVLSHLNELEEVGMERVREAQRLGAGSYTKNRMQ